jgi:hypothetical protein
MKIGTSPGRSASAMASTSSSASSGPPGCAGCHWSGFSAASISSWKISGSPVTHNISRKAVHTRRVQVCTRDQARIVVGARRS